MGTDSPGTDGGDLGGPQRSAKLESRNPAQVVTVWVSGASPES